MKRWTWPIGLYVLAALTLTWPLALHITTSIPIGSERTPTVPFFNLWTMGWNVSRVQVGYREYWDAPIFHPVEGAFAFSEPQPLTGLLAVPLWPFSPTTAYNSILLLFLVSNGLAVYVFLHRRGLSFLSALMGGLLALSLPFLTEERGVLHLLPVFGVILAIDGLWSLTEEPSWQAGLRLGLGVAITFLVSEQFALFLGILLPVVIVFLPSQVRRKRLWLSAGLALVVTAIFVLPVAIPQMRILEEMAFSRSEDTVTRGSAQIADYLSPSSASWQSRWFPLQSGGTHRLFPGAILICLAAGGSIVGFSQKRQRKWTAFLIISAMLAFLFSLGLNLKLGYWQPYNILREFVPGFNNLRSPFRIGYLVQIYFLLLSALFLEWLSKRQGPAVTLILVGLVFLETLPRGARLATVPAAIESDDIIGPTLFLPFPEDRATAAYTSTTSWMTASLPLSITLVNGYSGFFPTLQSQLNVLLADFPSPAGITALRTLGVKTIVIRQDWLDIPRSDRLVESMAIGDLQEVATIGDFRVFHLTDAQLHPASAYDGGWAVETSLKNQEIELRVYAAVPDKQMYVMVPQIAPLDWRVQLNSPGEETHISYVSPSNAVLLYHGSDRWLTVSAPLPPGAHGQYVVQLVDDGSNKILAERQIDVNDIP